MSQIKKKILFVSTRPPYPLLSGEKNKTFNEIKVLSKKYRIIYCSLCPGKDVPEVEKMLMPFCEEVHLYNTSIVKSLLGCFDALLNGRPLQIGYFSSKELKKFCEKKSNEVDGVFVNLFRAVQYVENIEHKMFLDMSDSISEHYKNAINITSSLLWRAIYKIESRRMRIYEDQFIPIFKKVFLFNPEEIKIYKTNNLVWIPHGVNKKVLDYDYQADFRRNLKISFLGKMDYRPNVEAVKWFAQNVLPKLKPQFSFQIIGAFPSKEVLALKNNPRIEVTGFVDDPYRILLESHCVVAPMISGGGIQNKLLESMAIGCVNIVSTICARPLNGINNEIIVSDDPERIAKIINELDPQSEYYQMIQKASKDYIVNNYTWDKYEEVLYKEISL